MSIRRAPLLALLTLACAPAFGPDEAVSFFVVMANDTDGAGAGPDVEVVMAMQFSTRNAELDFELTSRETDLLGPGETDVLQYLNGPANGQPQFEAREPGAATVLATATCTYRDGVSDTRRVSLTGDEGGSVGYTLACEGW